VRYNIQEYAYDEVILESDLSQYAGLGTSRRELTILIAKLTAILRLANSYSILVMQRSEHESMCTTETGTYATYNSYKSVLAIVCVSPMLTVEMLLLYVVRGWLHVRIY